MAHCDQGNPLEVPWRGRVGHTDRLEPAIGRRVRFPEIPSQILSESTGSNGVVLFCSGNNAPVEYPFTA